MRHEFRDLHGLLFVPAVVTAVIVTIAGVIGATYR